MPAAEATPALPHEIAGPFSYLPYPLPVLIAAAVVIMVLLGLAAWGLRVFLQRRHHRPATPREAALAGLAQAARRTGEADPYEFGILVSDILRRFLSEEYRLPATTQTSHEFLHGVRAAGRFDESRLADLGRFLDRADMIKFARASATAEDNAALVELAAQFVKGGAAHASAS